MGNNANRLKKIAYDFDLVSGKVNQVSYQPGFPDAFYHRYVYDAENRITNVLTSSDSINWDNDAFYQYYDHGPLARTVLGEQQVQGVNYAYNLQGWMKSINPAIYDSAGFTLKADGSTGTVVGKTAYNVMLNYFNGDYKAISGAAPQDASINVTLGGQYRPLYNGNISSMAVNVGALNGPLLYNYQYDQLNRLVAMDAWKKTGNAWNNLDTTSDFRERVGYDANGNILSYIRNGNTAGGKPLEMDRLAYNYKPGTNQLDYVHDTVPAGNYEVDIDAQTAGNYAYDSIGNLIKNKADSIASISWTVYGKISQIKKDDGTVITYTYGTDGNRISKSVVKGGETDTTTTWYVRDASGNVMSVYESGKPAVNIGHLTQSELHLYGSSRLGLLRRSLDVAYHSGVNPDPTKIAMPLLGTADSITFVRGDKLFELSNHLGNVLVTLSDKKLGVSSNNTTVDYFNPQVVSAQDYYPFGMLQPGRSYNVGGYRYGFNGQERSDEIKGEGNSYTAEFWEYDSRLGRRWNIDPIPKRNESPYLTFSNNPMSFIDPNGADTVDVKSRTFDVNGKRRGQKGFSPNKMLTLFTARTPENTGPEDENGKATERRLSIYSSDFKEKYSISASGAYSTINGERASRVPATLLSVNSSNPFFFNSVIRIDVGQLESMRSEVVGIIKGRWWSLLDNDKLEYFGNGKDYDIKAILLRGFPYAYMNGVGLVESDFVGNVFYGSVMSNFQHLGTSLSDGDFLQVGGVDDVYDSHAIIVGHKFGKNALTINTFRSANHVELNKSSTVGRRSFHTYDISVNYGKGWLEQTIKTGNY